MKGRSTSKTFTSNEVFYGVDTNGAPADNPSERFQTTTKLALQTTANASASSNRDSTPVRYARGMKPMSATLEGIVGGGVARNDRSLTPVKGGQYTDKHTVREKLRLKAQITAISEANQALAAEQKRQAALQTETEKKKNSKLAKYLTDRDTLAALEL